MAHAAKTATSAWLPSSSAGTCAGLGFGEQAQEGLKNLDCRKPGRNLKMQMLEETLSPKL